MSPQKLLSTLPELRVEIQAQRQWITAHTLQLGPRGFCIASTDEIAVGTPMNILLYVPEQGEVELIKVHGRAVRCDEVQGLYEVEARFDAFAPGDERRWGLWLSRQGVTVASPARTRPMRRPAPKVA